MKHLVLGIAGHIDHGKTSLVKSLTGVDTDRLKEEKERGITIDLGFASLLLPSGITLSIIDVPGHERFVKNMVAGAAGIDMVLLVIAADDGVMPQTREHLEICSLLGINHGLVAVTKSDMVDYEWLTMTIEDIKEFLKGSFLEGAPVIPVSSITGKGKDELISSIDSLAGTIEHRRAEGIFRMPIDRAFTIKGFGTVVTGTVLSGKIRVGNEIEILPKGIRARVRGIQTHGTAVQEGIAGSRVAINLQGVEREEVKRGDTASSPGFLSTSIVAEVVISMLSSAPRPLRDGMEPIFHFATTSIPASLVLLGPKEIRPGERGFARIKVMEPITAMHGDRFVMRFSDAGTIGGGVFLDLSPPKRSRKEAIGELNILASNDLKAKASLYIKRGGVTGITSADLSVRLNVSEAAFEPVLSELTAAGDILKIDEKLVSARSIKNLRDSIISNLEAFHKKEPIKEGVLREELRTRLKVPQKVLVNAIETLVKDRLVVMEKDALRLAFHEVSGGEIKERVEKIYMETGLTPLTLTELLERLKIKEKEALDILNLLSREGKLVKVKEFFFSKDAVDGLITKVREFFNAKNEMTPVDFKEVTGLSRKFAIPLLEYLDSQKVTIRVGDARRLRNS